MKRISVELSLREIEIIENALYYLENPDEEELAAYNRFHEIDADFDLIPNVNKEAE